jgi:hypothetical protein
VSSYLGNGLFGETYRGGPPDPNTQNISRIIGNRTPYSVTLKMSDWVEAESETHRNDSSTSTVSSANSAHTDRPKSSTATCKHLFP